MFLYVFMPTWRVSFYMFLSNLKIYIYILLFCNLNVCALSQWYLVRYVGPGNDKDEVIGEINLRKQCWDLLTLRRYLSTKDTVGCLQLTASSILTPENMVKIPSDNKNWEFHAWVVQSRIIERPAIVAMTIYKHTFTVTD